MKSRLVASLGIALAAVALALATDVAQTATRVDTTRLPLGDGHVSTTGAQRGFVYACSLMHGGGAFRDGPWIHDDGTFDLTAKVTVDGAIKWSAAHVRIRRSNGRVVISGNGLPVGATTGAFPIASTDDAYQYDRNPNSIQAQSVSVTLPKARAASTPGCLTGGPVGYAVNGVAIFNALDAENRDALAHEVQDSCGGHPERTGVYHYHAIPACLTSEVRGSGAKVVGWMLDGYPIVTEPGVTNDQLDACHGRTSKIKVLGKRVRTYHYDATAEYPYTIGCFHGTPLRLQQTHPPN